MTNQSTEREMLSLCRVCSAICGTKVVVRGDEIVSIKGDPDHPVSIGYTCNKGRSMAEFHTRSDRLNTPMVGGEPVDWEQMLDATAATLASIIERHGPGSVGFYTGTGQVHDRPAAWTMNRLLAALGSRQRYTAATVDVAPKWRANELVTGYAQDLVLKWEPEEDSPRTVILIGSNPVVSHGSAHALMPAPARKLRDFRRRGGDLWVIDPRRTETAAVADHHLAPVPGTDPLILAWLVGELFRDGADQDELRLHADPADVKALINGLQPFTLDVVANESGIAAEDLRGLLDAIRASGPVMCIGGTGTRFGPDALVCEWLIWVLHIITGSVDRPGGMRIYNSAVSPKHLRTSWNPAPPEGRRQPGPASRPELSGWFDELPAAAMVDEIESGTLRALLVSGANPLTAFPDSIRTTAALGQLELLGVFDVAHNSITAAATHVFPMLDCYERPDIDGRESNMYAPALVNPVGERKPQWWVLAQLARRLGFDILDGLDPDTCSPEQVAAMASGVSAEKFSELQEGGPHGIPVDRPMGWMREVALPGGRWRLAPAELMVRLPALLQRATKNNEFHFVSGRLGSVLNSVHYVDSETETTKQGLIMINPADADSIRAVEGDNVRLRTSTGSLSGVLRFDSTLRRGTVHAAHGLTEQNVNLLIDRRDGLDPLTGQACMSAFTVELELELKRDAVPASTSGRN